MYNQRSDMGHQENRQNGQQENRQNGQQFQHTNTHNAAYHNNSYDPQNHSQPAFQSNQDYGANTQQYKPHYEDRDMQAPTEINPDLAPGGKFYSIKIHGSSAAVEFKADVTRKGVHTVRIEAAKGSNKQFNWNDKVSIQLTHTGMIDLLNVFLFIQPLADLRHYGVNNDKSIKIELQSGNKLFTQVTQAGKGMHGIPVPINEGIRIGQFIEIFRENPLIDAKRRRWDESE